MSIGKHLSLTQAILLLGSSLSLLLALTLSSPQHLASSSQTMLAQVVGLTAGVLPNTDNMLAAQFATKEKELADREARVAQQESQSGSIGNADTVAMISLGVSATLFVLLGINFYLDMRRRSGSVSPSLSLDLRRR